VALLAMDLQIAEKIFIRLAVIASETREMSRNSNRIWPYSRSRSSKVIDLGVIYSCSATTLLIGLLKSTLGDHNGLLLNRAVE